MKLKLPNKVVSLDVKLSFEERNDFIHKLLSEDIGSMTLEEYFRQTWDKRATIVAMDVIAYYLTKGNTDGEDRKIISNKKKIEMKRGSTRHTTFSGMGYDNQVSFGVIDVDDYNFN